MSDSGSEDDSWDVEKYRVDYESEEHWDLRKVRALSRDAISVDAFNQLLIFPEYFFKSDFLSILELHGDSQRQI